MYDIQDKVSALYEQALSAYALFIRDEDAVIKLLWQNPQSERITTADDFYHQPLFKLELMDCLANQVPQFFDFSVGLPAKKMQFIATPFADDFILINFSEKPASDAFEIEQDVEIQEQEVYHSLIDSANLGVLQWDIKQDSLHFDERARHIFGFTKNKADWQYADFLQRVFAEDQSKLSDAMEEHIAANWPLKVEFRTLGDNGHHYWVLLRGQALWNDNNEAVKLFASIEDISERKHTEDELRQRESLIEQMIDALPLSIELKDAQGCYRFFNSEAEVQKGMQRVDLIGRTDYEVYPPQIAKEKAEQDRQVYESKVLSITEKEDEKGEGWLLIGRIPINIQLPNSLTQTWLLSFSLDITERKAMEDALKKANLIAEEAARSKANFLSVMSHEIRTPLNSVIGNAGLLLHEGLEPNSAQHVEMIKRSGEHLLYLINDILDFNKLEAGKVELVKQAVDIKQQLQTVLNMSMTNATSKNITLTSEIAEDIGAAYLGDEGRIRQILLNLIGNAIKFTDQGGVKVKLLAVADNSKLRFEVHDTGIGIAEENIPKLFAEFSQAEASTSSKYGGSGLGLAICKKLVEAMGGDIGILSQLGKGSQFWFEIPSHPTASTENAKESVASEVEVNNLQILVAEDNLPNQFLIKSILKKLGHQVTIANNGLEAVAAVEDESSAYDLVLMDMQMPEMDGLEATRMIRKMQQDKALALPIIALTANAYNEVYDSVIEAGMNDCLTKPIIVEDLKRALNQWGAEAINEPTT